VAAAAVLALALCTGSPGGGTGAWSGRGTPAVGLSVLRFVDRTRVIHWPGGRTEPRTLVTYVRYPAVARSAGVDLAGALPARADGPFPLVVFGHGFAVTPAPYAGLLRAWAQAGYVVAAPVFPLENANAPGGPNEADLINQPADMQFVIARLVTASMSGTGPLRGLIDASRIAVAGHSDGAETALIVAYEPAQYDPRIRAAVLLSGAQTPPGGITFLKPSTALLATQGTADTVNPAAITGAFFRIAPRPKFLLRLLGAEHLPPYTDEQPQLSIVERVTIAFLDHYLKRGSLRPLLNDGTVPGVATLVSHP
jgi:dienelactone hydrolase